MVTFGKSAALTNEFTFVIQEKGNITFNIFLPPSTSYLFTMIMLTTKVKEKGRKGKGAGEENEPTFTI